MHLTAMGDYALRAMTEIAAVDPERIKAERIARSQRIPLKFVENILITLKHAGLINAMRGATGGYWLARPAAEITLADIIRAVEGPLANVRGTRPDQLKFSGSATALEDVWIAVRVNLRNVLEAVTLEHVVRAKLPAAVMRLTRKHDARRPH